MKTLQFQLSINAEEDFFYQLISVFEWEKRKITDYYSKQSRNLKHKVHEDDYWKVLFKHSNDQLGYTDLIKQLENHLKEHGTPIQED